MPSTRPGPIPRILEPDRVRRRADRPPGRHVHARAQGERRRRLQRLEPAGQRRRMDRPDHRRGRARRPRLGDRLVQLHRPAQPDAARLQDRQGQRLRDAAARQDPRPDLPHRLQGRPAVAGRRCSIPADARGLVAALANDNQFWRLHAQRLLVERGKTRRRARAVKLARRPSVDAIGLNAGAIHALWTLHGLGALGGFAVGGRRRPPWPRSSIRRPACAAMRCRSCRATRARPTRSSPPGLLRDPDAQVRLAALLASRISRRRTSVAAALAMRCAAGWSTSDRWLADAATAAAARNDAVVLEGAGRPARRRPAAARGARDRRPRGRALGAGRSERVGRRPPGGAGRRRAGGERGDHAGPGPRLAQGPAGPSRRRDERRAQAPDDRADRRRRGRNWSAWSASGATRPSTAWAPRSPRRSWHRLRTRSLPSRAASMPRGS